MAGNTSVQIPTNLSDNIVLRRVLENLSQNIDILKGFRGNGKALVSSDLTTALTTINKELETMVKVNGTRVIKAPLQYSEIFDLENAEDSTLIHKFYLDDRIQPNISDLSSGYTTISDPPTQSEVQSIVTSIVNISTKVNDILEALVEGKVIED